MIKVSIVVPIYNVERYLRQCVDSILGQSLKEIEVILVDDGSTDGSSKIVDEYGKKDSRVVVVHQKNVGYGVAVNRGIKLAKGEYVGIIESDDWIESNMYAELYREAKLANADIAKGGFFVYDSTQPKGKQDWYFANASGVDLRLAPRKAFEICEWSKLLAFHPSIWSAIYRADLIKAVKIPETAGASYQDFPFVAEMYCRAKRIVVDGRGFVHWRNEPDQNNSSRVRGKKALLMAQNTRLGVEKVKELGCYDKVKEALGLFVIRANAGFFYEIDRRYQKEYYEILHEILKPMEEDKNFSFLDFGKHDKMFFDLMVERDWRKVEKKTKIILMIKRLKQKIIRR